MIRACQKNENAAFDGWKRRFLDSINGGRFNTGLPAHGQVAQSVEQWTENPRVGGSIPPLATIPFKYLRQRSLHSKANIFLRCPFCARCHANGSLYLTGNRDSRVLKLKKVPH